MGFIALDIKICHYSWKCTIAPARCQRAALHYRSAEGYFTACPLRTVYDDRHSMFRPHGNHTHHLLGVTLFSRGKSRASPIVDALNLRLDHARYGRARLQRGCCPSVSLALQRLSERSQLSFFTKTISICQSARSSGRRVSPASS